jgi:hypothetical protein
MRIFLTFFFLIFLVSSASSQMIGNYKKRGKDFSYTLNLNCDSILVLSCSEPTLPEQLQSAYISERTISVEILKNGKLKIDRVVLARIKE